MKISGLLCGGALLVSLGFVASIGGAHAHDLWITAAMDAGKDAGKTRVIVNYGHPNDRPPPFADKLIELQAVTRDGKVSLLKDVAQSTVNDIYVLAAPYSGGTAVLLEARYDNGFWVKTADGTYRNANKLLVPKSSESTWSIKFAKTLLGKDAPWDRIVGHDLEIVPLSDPSTLVPGGVLKARVLYHGKPLGGVEVERGDGFTPMAEKDIPKFRTDKSGVVEIPIVKTGPHLLAIDYKVKPSRAPNLAESDLYNATLAFNVAQGS